MAKAYTELADCGIIDTGAGRAARVKRVKPIPEPLVRAAKTYADEARRLGASLVTPSTPCARSGKARTDAKPTRGAPSAKSRRWC